MDALPGTDISTKALVVEKPGAPFVLRDVVLDEVREKELLVEIKYAGLCHTDLAVKEGRIPFGAYPVIPGHEGAGVILKLGSGLEQSGLQVGDRVLLAFSSCLNCEYCKEGRKGACNDIAMINFVGTRGPDDTPARLTDGTPVRGDFFGQSSFGNLAICDSRSVVKYDGLVEDLAFLAPLGCGYMTGAATVLNVLQPQPHHRLAIFGLGAVGLCALMAAKSLKVEEVLAIDIVDWRLDFSKSLGATHTISAKGVTNIEDAIRQVFPEGVNFIIDTTGRTSMINGGVKALAHAGTFAVVGTPQPEDISIDPLDLLIHCKKIIGITGGYANPQEFIPHLLHMYKSGTFPIKELSKVYQARDVEQAIQDMKSGQVIKPVLAW